MRDIILAGPHVRQAAAAVKLDWKETDSLVLRRGPYVVAAGLDESLPESKSYVLRGRYLNLFDPELAVLTHVTIAPRSRMLLLDLNQVKATGMKVVAAAFRIRNEKTDGRILDSGPRVSAAPMASCRS